MPDERSYRCRRCHETLYVDRKEAPHTEICRCKYLMVDVSRTAVRVVYAPRPQELRRHGR